MKAIGAYESPLASKIFASARLEVKHAKEGVLTYRKRRQDGRMCRANAERGTLAHYVR